MRAFLSDSSSHIVGVSEKALFLLVFLRLFVESLNCHAGIFPSRSHRAMQSFFSVGDSDWDCFTLSYTFGYKSVCLNERGEFSLDEHNWTQKNALFLW